jgi:hypothetical protein
LTLSADIEAAAAADAAVLLALLDEPDELVWLLLLVTLGMLMKWLRS